MSEKRLYGLPDGEYMERSIEDVYESQIEPFGNDGTHIIEEWTVRDRREPFPTVSQVIDYIVEWADSVTEEWSEEVCRVADLPEVRQAFEDAIALMVSKIDYEWADKKVGTHEITHEDGEPFLDGQPMYRRSVHPSVLTGGDD